MSLRIALAQVNTTVGALKANQQKILQFIAQARQSKADVVVFPELALTGYPPEDLLLKPHFVENNLKALKELARQVKGITTIVGFVDADRKEKHLYNAAAVINDGKVAKVFHKKELPNYSVFDEKRYFASGETGKVFSVKGISIGINICEDIWVDGGPYQKQAKSGAKVLINISSSPYHVGKLRAREKLLKARAKETGVHVVYVNLVGGQDELVFDGASMVIDRSGKVLAMGKQFEEDLVVVDLPAEKSHRTLAAKPLSEVEEIYKALAVGTRDYVQKNGFKKVVLGLSGGIDSSLVAAIACDAIGRENVVGVSMPSVYNSEGTKADARKLADNLGIEFMEIPIWEVFTQYRSTFEPVFKGSKPGVAEENLQARIRGNILMALSNKFGWLVLTTGNKSEMAVGYCTLYGDMSGGFAVIKDILKTKVYELSRYRNRVAGKDLIPESVLTRVPSAELRSNQTDQDSLPPYDELDQILEDYVEDHLSPEEMVKKKHDLKTIQKVIKLVDQSEYKRRQSPPGIKITERAFGKDWRLPITNQYRIDP